MGGDDRRGFLEELYRTAVNAADPVSVTRSLLEGAPLPPDDANIWIIGAGKAVEGMASALVEWLGPHRRERVSGLLIPVADIPRPRSRFERVAGDHPVPGTGSFRAARRLEELAPAVALGDQVYVLLSGGATSLMGAPLPGIPERDYRLVFELLLAAGLDITEMNRVRKQISRWGAGRLAEAVRPAMVQPVIMSDVESNDPATIASGPCSPDDIGARAALQILAERELADRVPSSVRDFLVRAAGREQRESSARALSHVSPPLLAAHSLPVDAVEALARAHGHRVIRGPRLRGKASTCGRDLAALLISEAVRSDEDIIFIAGGETTVTLSDDHGIGGRCQELALSAAKVFAESGTRSVTLLAAGTDGRDGPTDAAGAIVDGSTWNAIARSGRDPDLDLRRHDSHPSLDAAGALLRTGHSGTNMMDIAIAILRK
jgi:hydroxypyruvate reductase